MKKNLVVLSLVAALALISTPVFAGSGVSMRVSVPFEFYAGNLRLPAGEYSFEMGSGMSPTASVVTLRANDGTGIWIMATQAGTDRNMSTGCLLFNRYGARAFLSSVSIRGYKAGLKMQKLENELRAQARKNADAVVIAQK